MSELSPLTVERVAKITPQVMAHLSKARIALEDWDAGMALLDEAGLPPSHTLTGYAVDQIDLAVALLAELRT